MTGFLASVASVAEAEIALRAGADLIDLKDPGAGALGALPSATVRAAVTRIAGRRPSSATTGDLPMDPDLVLASATRLAGCGVDFVKVGFFPGGDHAEVLRALSGLADQGVRLIAVLFADHAADHAIGPEMLERLRNSGFAGAMLDTANKASGSLPHLMAQSAIARFTAEARGGGLLVGLAGSLGLDDIPALLPHRPDYLGFRGALCRGGRTDRLDPELVRAVRQAIPLAAEATESQAVSASAAAGAQRAAQSLMSSGPSISSPKSR